MVVCKYCGLTETTYYKLKKHIAKDHVETNSKIQCDKCMKELTSKQTLRSHKITCDGLSSLQCQYCHKSLSNRYSKYRHQKACQSKPIETYKEDVRTIPSITNNNNNIDKSVIGNFNGDYNTMTNNINYNTSNITNNNNSVIVFGDDDSNHFAFDMSVIGLAPIFNKVDYTDDKGYLKALYQFSNILFSIPKNRCVKKTNMKMRHSQIHKGNNEWETIDDSLVYDKLVRETSLSLMNKLDECEDNGDLNSINKRKLHYLRGKTEPFINKIYDDEVELTRDLRIIKNNTKNIVYTYSRKK
jgi:hypothetical protein